MKPTWLASLPRPSLLRTFAVLSLITITLITAVQVSVQWVLVRDGLLEWERTSIAESVRADALAVLQPEDFERWQSEEAQTRFALFFRLALAHPEILRVKLYSADMRVVWSDEPRLVGVLFPENAHLQEALGGRVVAHLKHADKAENLYERGFARTVEVYVPLIFTARGIPGTARVTGVVEIYKDSSRVLAGFARDRLTIIAASMLGAIVLYTALFWIVRRASRQLRAQRRDLEQHAEALMRSNEELRATQRQLGASERLAAIGEVSATVAHGIRNPLANIRAAAQVALATRTDADLVERYLGSIVSETDRLSVWLRGLLDTVRPFEPQLVPVDVNGIVTAVLEVMAARAAEGQVSMQVLQAADLPKVPGDDVHLQQALLGIVENAVDAAAPGGLVEVRTELADSQRRELRVMVRDDGPGIPHERLSKVFEPFYTSKTQGTGLGLSIARKVVEAHRGRIEIDSQPGAGTTVTVVLPAVQGAA